MKKMTLLHHCMIGLLNYENRFNVVPAEHAQWICDRLAWHKLLPLAAALPNEGKSICRALSDVFLSTTLQNMIKEKHYYRQAATIFQALEAAPITYIPFKGPFWLGRLYKTYHWRHIGDLDLLIAKKDVPKAAEILSTMGYQAQFLEGDLEKEMATRGELAFFPESKLPRDVPVELHWDLMPSPRFLKKHFLNMEDFTSDSGIGHWQALTFVLPRPEIQFIYYVLHATCQHQFMRFAHLATLIHFIRHHPDLDWELLLRLAVTRQIQTPFYYALVFMESFSQLPETLDRLKIRLKPRLHVRLAAACLTPDHILNTTGKRGSLRRKIFRAAMSW